MSETIAGKAGKKRNSLEKSAFNMAMTISLLLLAAVITLAAIAMPAVQSRTSARGLFIQRMQNEIDDLRRKLKRGKAQIRSRDLFGFGEYIGRKCVCVSFRNMKTGTARR